MSKIGWYWIIGLGMVTVNVIVTMVTLQVIGVLR